MRDVGVPVNPDMKTYYEGTAVKITMIISKPTATCTITIENPSSVAIVDAATMTKDSDYVYSYIYQSTTTNSDGPWTVTLKAAFQAYTAVTQDTVFFEEQKDIII